MEPEGDLQWGRIAARGGVATVSTQVLRVLLQFATIPVLARLLTPDDFGLVATAMIAIAFGDVVKDFGLSAAGLQAKSLSLIERSTLFWANLGIGVTLAALMVPVSLVLPLLFQRPELTSLALALGLSFPVAAAQTQYVVDLARKGKFVALNATALIAQAVGAASAITCAINGAGYWSLVVQVFATGLTSLAALATFGGWRPRPPWVRTSIRSHLSFGANLGGAQLAGYVAANSDTALISFRDGAAAAGVYNRAFQLLVAPIYQIAVPLMNVVVPALSRTRDRSEQAFLSLLRRVVVAVGTPLVLVLSVACGLAQEVVAVVLGPRWHETAPLFAILSMGGMFQVLLFVSFWTFLALAQTRQLLFFSLVIQGGTVVAVLIGSAWGVTGIAWGVCLAHASSWPLSVVWLRRCADIPWRLTLAPGTRILFSAAATVILLRASPAQDTVWSVIVWGIVGCAAFLVMSAASRSGRHDLATILAARRHLLSRPVE